MISRAADPTEAEILGLVSVSEMKLHLRLVGTAQDDVVKACLMAAFSMLDGPGGRYRRSLVGTQSYELVLDRFPSSGEPLYLAYPPIRDVASVSYLDADGDLQVMTSADYKVVKDRVRPVIRSKTGIWPESKNEPGAVTVSFTAGWDAASVPHRVKLALKMLAAHFFENREATLIDNRSSDFVHEVPIGVRELIAQDRVPNSF